ncbi:MAG: 16S rRNA (cytosine(1402)-N(4))-methyltransferase RsmH [Patescibacteria group bacterium]
MTTETSHIPVLLKEVIDFLEFAPEDKIFLDATLGAGGHSAEVCRKFPFMRIIGIDVDETSAKIAEKNLAGICKQFEIKITNFRNLENVLSELKIAEVDKVLFDLGMSSMQIDSATRGFSFLRDEPLLMTMNNDLSEGTLTAYEIVNGWPKEDLRQILKEYGEESFASQIADQIIKERKNHKIETTFGLVKVIIDATPEFYHHGRINPATKTFQALRIAVNDELNAIKEGLEQAFHKLKKGGRMAVISFHSGEDRIVKTFFKQLKTDDKAILINKKPILATLEEIEANPRSRSAKLRVIEKNV